MRVQALQKGFLVAFFLSRLISRGVPARCGHRHRDRGWLGCAEQPAAEAQLGWDGAAWPLKRASAVFTFCAGFAWLSWCHGRSGECHRREGAVGLEHQGRVHLFSKVINYFNISHESGCLMVI